MKKDIELTTEEVVKRLQNWMKPSLFLPIFYTIVLGLSMFAFIVDGDGAILYKILIGLIFTGLIVMFWFIYITEKKKSKVFNFKLEEDLAHLPSDEESDALKSSFDHEEITRLYLSILKLNVISSVSMGLFGLSLSVLKTLDVATGWIVLSSILFGGLFVISIVMTFHYHKKMRELSKQFEESK